MGKRAGVANVLLLIVVVVAIPLLVTGVGAASADTSNQQTSANGAAIEVSECRTIDEPGRYILTGDIEDSSAEECITIIASDVVFDGQGHTLEAREVDHPTEAIAAGYTDPPIENITIKNLIVTGWTQGIGCRAVASDVTIENVTAHRNGLYAAGDGYGQEEESYGIYVGELTRNVTVIDSLAVNNSQGIVIADTSNNVIRENLVQDNGAGGIILGANTSRNRIVDNRIVDNGVVGIKVVSQLGVGTSNQTTIRANVLRRNKRGVLLEHTNTTISVVDNQIQNSTHEGIWVAVVEGDVTIVRNSILETNGDGVVLDATNNVVVRSNRIRNVAGTGILLKYESRENMLRDNHVIGAQHGLHITDQAGETVVRGLVVRQSRNQSILFDGAGKNTLVGSTVRGGNGIEVKSSANQLRNLTVTDTHLYGIRLDGANHTRIQTVTTRNTGVHAYETVGRSVNVTLRNLSLDSGRVSLTGPAALIAGVDDIPTPPAGKYDVGAAIRIRVTRYDTDHNEPAMLTIHYPSFGNFAPNMTLWQWYPDDIWTQFDNVSVHPERNALSAPLPANRDIVVVPLAATPPPTRTPTLTQAPTPTPTPTSTSTSTPTATVGAIAGFGGCSALLALVLSVLVGIRTRR